MKIHDGEIISDDWDVDAIEHGLDNDTLKKLPWLSDIDTSLCSTATIAKTESGRYLLIWKQSHPEMISFSQWLDDREWPNGPTSLDDERQEYVAAIGAVPPGLEDKEFSKEITREQAWKTIAYFWLPEEWHGDAGIA